MSKRIIGRIAVGTCALAIIGTTGCKSDAPQTLSDQKAAVTGATAPPGALKAIADAQAEQNKHVQAAAQAGPAAAQAAAAKAAQQGAK